MKDYLWAAGLVFSLIAAGITVAAINFLFYHWIH
jgi:hypothetical protein